jgi:hypothetical protein
MRQNYALQRLLEPQDQAALAKGQESLQFYLYRTHRKCSESRLDQVKKGLPLANVAKTQETAFVSATNSPTFRLSQRSSLSPESVAPVEFARTSTTKGSLSPAMKKYVSMPTFDRDMERNKHQKLAAYFQVTAK